MQQEGVDIDASDKQGCTPLILGAVYNNSISVAILLNHGASFLKKDKLGQNVLHKAAKEGNTDVVEAIEEYLHTRYPANEGWKRYFRALMTSRDERGNTPLMLALDSVISGKTLKYFLKIDKELELNQIKGMNNKMKETPMHRACR